MRIDLVNLAWGLTRDRERSRRRRTLRAYRRNRCLHKLVVKFKGSREKLLSSFLIPESKGE